MRKSEEVSEEDKELIRKLTKAQVKFAAELMLDDHWKWSDDGLHYCQSAVELADIMLQIYWNNDVERLTGLLNNKPYGVEESLGNFPGDGLSDAFYEPEPAVLS